MIVLIGLIFIFLPIVSFPLLFFSVLVTKNNNSKKIYMFLMAISIALILYHCMPNETTDLYRYYKIIESYSLVPASDVFKVLFSSPESLSYFLFYVVYRIGNPNVLMLITTIVSYSILLYIIFDYQKSKKLSNVRFNIIIIYFLCTFLIVYHITGVRFCLARLLFFLACYLDMYKNNRRLYVKILYIIPVLFHISSVSLILARLLLAINKNKFDIKAFVIIAFVIFSPQILFGITDFLSNFTFFSYISERLTDYTVVQYEIANIYLLQIALLIYMFFISVWIKVKRISTNGKLLNFTLIIMIMGLLFLNVSTIATRFISIACSFSVLLLMDLLSEIKRKDFIFISIMSLLFSGFYLAFQIIQLTRFGTYYNLIGFKLFDSGFALILLTIYVIINYINTKMEDRI